MMIKKKESFSPLFSERLLYSEMNESHAPQFHELYSDPRVCAPMGIPRIDSLMEARDTITTRRANDAYTWIVRTKDENEFIGVFGVHDVNWQHRHGKIGGGLLPSRWRRGYGLEIVKRLSSFGFEELSLHRIEAHLYPENVSMKELFLKAGFKIEGRLRENYFHGGKVGDTLIMGLLFWEK